MEELITIPNLSSQDVDHL